MSPEPEPSTLNVAGLRLPLRETAVVLATFAFVFTHLGKPELETLSTFFGGIGFGWLAQMDRERRVHRLRWARYRGPWRSRPRPAPS